MNPLPPVLLALWCCSWCVAQDRGRLVVVAPRAVHAALDGYVAHRRRALDTELLALEDALAGGDGVDDAEKLKRALFERWRDGARYVLLVGDCDVVPVRFMVLDRNTDAAAHRAFYPSDLYYADVAEADGSFEDWNATRDAYFGEVRGEHHKDGPIDRDRVDYLPELAVGRWPVRTPDEVARVAARTIAFETGTPATTPRALLLHCDGWVDARAPLARAERALEPRWLVVRDDARLGRTPDAATVLDQLARGVDLVLHAGHGSPGGLQHSFGAAELPRLAALARPPIVLSVGCSTAVVTVQPPYEPYVDTAGTAHAGTNDGERFAAPPPPPATLQSGAFERTSLGERAVRDGGAVAWIGCVTGSQPCALTLLEEFAAAAGARDGARLGDCWNAALRGYHRRERLAALEPTESWYPPSVFFQGMKFVLLGDPSLALPAAPAHHRAWTPLAEAELAATVVVRGRIAPGGDATTGAYRELSITVDETLKGAAEPRRTLRFWAAADDDPNGYDPSGPRMRLLHEGAPRVVLLAPGPGGLYLADRLGGHGVLPPTAANLAELRRLVALHERLATQALAIDPELGARVAALARALPDDPQRAVDALLALGPRAIPAVVRRLDDPDRALPGTALAIPNPPGAFEATRHVGAESLHGALVAVLEHLAGRSLGDTPEAARAWRVFAQYVQMGLVPDLGG